MIDRTVILVMGSPSWLSAGCNTLQGPGNKLQTLGEKPERKAKEKTKEKN